MRKGLQRGCRTLWQLLLMLQVGCGRYKRLTMMEECADHRVSMCRNLVSSDVEAGSMLHHGRLAEVCLEGVQDDHG